MRMPFFKLTSATAHTNDVQPAVYCCTSEQMDLWRQVFAEEAHRAARKTGPEPDLVGAGMGPTGS
jgi:hypothetical protein